MVGIKKNYKKLLGKLKNTEEISNINVTEFCQGRQVRWGIAWSVKQEKKPIND